MTVYEIDQIQRPIPLNKNGEPFSSEFSIKGNKPFSFAITTQDDLERGALNFQVVNQPKMGKVVYDQNIPQQYYIVLVAEESTQVDLNIKTETIDVQKEEFSLSSISNLPNLSYYIVGGGIAVVLLYLIYSWMSSGDEEEKKTSNFEIRPFLNRQLPMPNNRQRPRSRHRLLQSNSVASSSIASSVASSSVESSVESSIASSSASPSITSSKPSSKPPSVASSVAPPITSSKPPSKPPSVASSKPPSKPPSVVSSPKLLPSKNSKPPSKLPTPVLSRASSMASSVASSMVSSVASKKSMTPSPMKVFSPLKIPMDSPATNAFKKQKLIDRLQNLKNLN